jgi:hypothetical protein
MLIIDQPRFRPDQLFLAFAAEILPTDGKPSGPETATTKALRGRHILTSVRVFSVAAPLSVTIEIGCETTSIEAFRLDV